MKKTVATGIPFQVTDWNTLPQTTHPGETGSALWKTLQPSPQLRIREVVYSPGYLADHWCEKGHVLYVLEGSIVSELATGEKFVMNQGCSYVVSDTLSSHRSYSEHGTKLLIIDGDFLKVQDH